LQAGAQHAQAPGCPVLNALNAHQN
jgi:hypothetical protein